MFQGIQHKLLNLCNVSELRILNGRKLGDSLGKITCHENGRCLFKTKTKTGKPKYNKQKWFDKSCLVLRQEVKAAARTVSAHPYNSEARIEFFKRKKRV